MIGRVSSAFRVVAWGVHPARCRTDRRSGRRAVGYSRRYTCLTGVPVALLGLIVGRSFLADEPEPAPQSAPDRTDKTRGARNRVSTSGATGRVVRQLSETVRYRDHRDDRLKRWQVFVGIPLP